MDGVTLGKVGFRISTDNGDVRKDLSSMGVELKIRNRFLVVSITLGDFHASIEAETASRGVKCFRD